MSFELMANSLTKPLSWGINDIFQLSHVTLSGWFFGDDIFPLMCEVGPDKIHHFFLTFMFLMMMLWERYALEKIPPRGNEEGPPVEDISCWKKYLQYPNKVGMSHAHCCHF